ncbi:hypothetical protein JHK87_012124 [Glycine soja]|nr:hypothetical protein JHK87_012124 [Glycine soja]
MVMMGIEFIGTVPFSYAYLHGLIRDSQEQLASASYDKFFFGEVGRETYDFFWVDFADCSSTTHFLVLHVEVNILVRELDIVNNNQTFNLKFEVIQWREYRCVKITLSLNKFREQISPSLIHMGFIGLVTWSGGKRAMKERIREA